MILQYLEEAELQELLATKWVKIIISFGIYSFDFVFYLGMIYIGLWVLVVGILFRYKLFVEYTFKRSFWQFVVYINFLFFFQVVSNLPSSEQVVDQVVSNLPSTDAVAEQVMSSSYEDPWV